MCRKTEEYPDGLRAVGRHFSPLFAFISAPIVQPSPHYTIGELHIVL
jgi:hypothetical protein